MQYQNFQQGLRGKHPDDTYGRQMQVMANSLPTEKDLDDVIAYGANLHIELKGLSFKVQASHTEYESNFGGLDRDVTSVDFGFRFDAIDRFSSKLIDKLSLSRGETGW